MSDEKVMIFIDGSNFYHNLKAHHFNTKIDFKKFSDLLCKGRKHVRTYYYNAPIKQADDPGESAIQTLGIVSFLPAPP